jgi:hypothetical protein
MVGLSTEHLFRTLQLTGPGPDALTLEEGYVEVRVNAAIELSARLGDASLPLQHAEMLRSN